MLMLRVASREHGTRILAREHGTLRSYSLTIFVFGLAWFDRAVGAEFNHHQFATAIGKFDLIHERSHQDQTTSRTVFERFWVARFR